MAQTLNWVSKEAFIFLPLTILDILHGNTSQKHNKAQNTFGIVTGRVDWPEKFWLGHISLLTLS